MTKTAFLLALLAALCLAQDAPPETGTVTGITVDHAGRPIAGIPIRLGRGDDLAFLRTSSDDAGRFRFESVPPGTYYLSPDDPRYKQDFLRQDLGQDPRFVLAAGGTHDARLHLMLPAIVTGVVRDIHGDPIPNAYVSVLIRGVRGGRGNLMAAGSATTDDRGVYRIAGAFPGRARIEVAHRRSVIGGPGFATTYYGNTTDPSRARTLDIPPGGELTGIDIQVTPAGTFSITGRVIDRDTGQPVDGVGLSLLRPSRPSSAFTYQSRGGGFFEFLDLPPDEYAISAVPPIVVIGQTTPPPDVLGYALVRLTGSNVILDVPVGPGASVSGSLKMADGSPLPEAMRAQIALDPASPVNFAPIRPFAAKPDGSFERLKLHPLRYLLHISTNQSETFVQSINGEPAEAGRPVILDLSDGGAQSLEIVLSTKTVPLAGKTPAPALVAVWPARAEGVPAAGFESWDPHALRTLRTGEGNAFTFTGLAPGRYHLAAFDSAHPDIDALVFDPAFLRAFETDAMDLTGASHPPVDLAIQATERIEEIAAQLP